jgi:hypothetical protein
LECHAVEDAKEYKENTHGFDFLPQKSLSFFLPYQSYHHTSLSLISSGPLFLLQGTGERCLAKMIEILETGNLSIISELKTSPYYAAVSELQQIWGIGVKKGYVT